MYVLGYMLEILLWGRELYIYYEELIVDSGPGRLATAGCRRTRLPPDRWWPLAVAGES